MILIVRTRLELGHYLNSLGLTGRGVEVGVFQGEFAQCILESWSGRQLVLVDPWQHLPDYLDSWNVSDEAMENNYQLTITRLANFADRISILRMRSEEAVKYIEDLSCDFIYLDGNHAYWQVKRDLSLWYPKLRLNGLMSGHDYYDALADEKLEPILNGNTRILSNTQLTSYGVKSAVDEFAQNIGGIVHATKEVYPTWYFSKPGS